MNRYHKVAQSSPHWRSEGSNVLSDQNSPDTSLVPVTALNIIWGNDPRYWQGIKLTDKDPRLAGFESGAVLLQVNWIEVRGRLSLSRWKPGKYEIFYMIQFRVDAFGWHSVPIKFKVMHNGKETLKSTILEPYRQKEGVWHAISGGEFTLSEDAQRHVVFGMFETESDWWKGGMILGGIKITPKAY